MIKIGQFNKLEIIKIVDFGVYLDGGSFGDILLPEKYVPSNFKLNNKIDVFIYFDSNDRIIATTREPIAVVGEFAYLKVVSVSSFGAFLDWGLEKDLLVPYREQKQRMRKNSSYVVYIYLDKKSNRIAASSKLEKFLQKTYSALKEKQLVDILICEKTDMGYNAIINGKYMGLLYKNEIFRKIEIGQKTQGYIRRIREDNKIDLILDKPGFEKTDALQNAIISALKDRNNYLPLSDNSPPEAIYHLFGVSKKTYKKTIGLLYKKRIISIENNGIRLIKK